MTESPNLRVDARDKMFVVTITRDAKRNALTAQMIDDLLRVFAEFGDRARSNADPRVGVLTGEGRAFCAGMDIEELGLLSVGRAQELSARGHALCACIEQLPVPIIAAANGLALGGGLELALACDLLYASDQARFGLPEVGLGVIPGFGGTVRLPRRIGETRARELILTGDIIDAAKALALGLVNDVVPHPELLPRVYALAERIASKPPLAIAEAKRCVLRGLTTDPVSAGEKETQSFGRLFSTADQKEGMRAFAEKRAPSFQGR
jgi:enoyl-CoA hydratase